MFTFCSPAGLLALSAPCNHRAMTTESAGRVPGLPPRLGPPGTPAERSSTATIALIAHDAKKDDLMRLVRAHRHMFARWRLVVTGTTGPMLAEAVGLPGERMARASEAADPQIAARIVEQEADAVIFLRDPLTGEPHEPDVQAVLDVCDVHGIPVATNLASAEILLHFHAEHDRQVDRVQAAVAAGLDLCGEGVVPLDDD